LTEPRVFLAIPINRDVHPMVMNALLHMGSGYVTNAHVESDNAKYLDDKRNSAVEAFLKTDCTHLLFMDSDTIAEPESLKKLLDDDKDVVSAVIYKKGGDHSPCFGFYDEKTRTFHTPMPFPYNELIPVDTVGTGFVLIKRSVLEKVKAPWFECYDKGQAGEDVYFCAKCKDAGVQIYVDTGCHLGHVATPYIVTNETYEMSLLWRMVQTFKTQGRFEAFQKLLIDFNSVTPAELELQPEADSAFKLTVSRMGYHPPEKMKLAYVDYIRNVSKPEWAMSWQLATILDKTIRQMKPSRLLDLGSGFSSYVMRLSGTPTVSVDKDAGWLGKTRDFLEKNHLSTENLISMGDVVEPNTFLGYTLGWDEQFDIILLDYAMEDRVTLFKYCREHGRIILLDDMHFKDYREAAQEYFKDDIILSLEEETMDAYGRYAYMVVIK
jgi:hypothetical protein